jgi:Uncharacterized protein conserved in bacteria (DUF2252)
MNFITATRKYEAWLADQLTILPEDLAHKHVEMRAAPFPFFRATYYRWAQTWAGVCGPLARAPKVLAVGDLHAENFGTWRDIEGRLVWGINDFDEASQLPYTVDLIRLATSTLLAEMSCEPKDAVGAILEGYREALDCGGRPFILAEHHTALREMAVHRLRDPEAFWKKLHDLPECEHVPKSATKAIARLMPERGLEFKVSHRVAGLGSLGRERYVAVAQWHGGSVAREAKALAPAVWQPGPILYQKMLDTAVRCRDPFVQLQKRWIVRRLAPDCSRIELAALPKEHDALRLLHAMGFETANVHLGSVKPKVLRDDFRHRRGPWLYRAARAMEKAVLADFAEWVTAGA